ncbi:MAG: ribosome maturation factor RimM [Myxococcota bacterium]
MNQAEPMRFDNQTPQSVQGEDLVALAVVGRPHGITGEVRVHRYNDSSHFIEELSEVRLRSPSGETRTVAIQLCRPGPKFHRCAFEGVDDRNEAEALKGFELCVPREMLPDLADDEYYFVDLAGLAVVNSEGKTLGRVIRALQFPSIDCLEVDLEHGLVEVPMVEPWLLEVQLERRMVLVGDLSDLPVVRSQKTRAHP